MEREVAWNHYSEEEKKKVFEFAEEYRKFISACKTERECVRTFAVSYTHLTLPTIA